MRIPLIQETRHRLVPPLPESGNVSLRAMSGGRVHVYGGDKGFANYECGVREFRYLPQVTVHTKSGDAPVVWAVN